MRHTPGFAAVKVYLFHVLQLAIKTLAQFGDMGTVFFHILFGQGKSLAHANNLVGGQGTGTHAALVTATVHLGFQAHTRLAANIEGTNALGAIGLVAGERNQVHLHACHVNRSFAGGLGRIHVKQHLVGAGNFANGGNVVNGADLVVDVHDGDQNAVLAQRILNLLRMNYAFLVRIQIGNFKTFTLQLAHGVQHGFVFDFGGNQVLALAAVEIGHALDGQVVGLGGTRGPDDLARIGVNQIRHLLAGIFDCFLGAPAIDMRARSEIAKVAFDGQAVNHFFGHTRVNRGSGGIIKVNR